MWQNPAWESHSELRGMASNDGLSIGQSPTPKNAPPKRSVDDADGAVRDSALRPKASSNPTLARSQQHVASEASSLS
jgi:hypothetical protein